MSDPSRTLSSTSITATWWSIISELVIEVNITYVLCQIFQKESIQTCQTLLELSHRRRQQKCRRLEFQSLGYEGEEEENGGFSAEHLFFLEAKLLCRSLSSILMLRQLILVSETFFNSNYHSPPVPLPISCSCLSLYFL